VEPHDQIVLLAPIVAAPFIGSFLGLVVRRLPTGEQLVRGRSVCPHCRRRLTPMELVPVASWLLQGGKCRSCGTPLGTFYPAIELAATTIAVAAMFLTADPLSGWYACVLGWALLTLSWIDAETLLLPDALTLPLILAGLVLSIPGGSPAMLASGIGAAAGFAVLWLVGRGYEALAGKPGLGEGDVKLFAASGAWLGWAMLPGVIFVASALGITAAVAALLAGRNVTRETRIPFGPFIALATWIAFLAQHAGGDFAAGLAAYTGL
jgi:leader peptidase (prepilin peptidase)/N-methyltransferase